MIDFPKGTGVQASKRVGLGWHVFGICWWRQDASVVPNRVKDPRNDNAGGRVAEAAEKLGPAKEEALT